MNNKVITSKVDLLFKPLKIGSLELENRIVMAPMTRKFSKNGIPGKDVAEYYKKRAENGVGLIITEGTVINHPSSSNDHNIPHFFGENALKGWEEVVRNVHEVGGKIIPQIWHVGLDRDSQSSPNPHHPTVSPSGVNANGEKVGNALTIQDIQQIIDKFVEAAIDAKNLGFDGIELHGAHGYLIDQFFWETTNRRTDKYGGSLIKRTEFAAEIVRKCKEAVGEDFPIIIRISQWKTQDFTAKLAKTPDELADFLNPLVEAGVDAFHCSTRRFWEPEFEGSSLNLAGWTKKLTGKPVITVGSIGLDNEFSTAFLEGKGANTVNIDDLIQKLNDEEFDLVAIGRALLSDPEWAAKVKENRFNELLPFNIQSLQSLN